MNKKNKDQYQENEIEKTLDNKMNGPKDEKENVEKDVVDSEELLSCEGDKREIENENIESASENNEMDSEKNILSEEKENEVTSNTEECSEKESEVVEEATGENVADSEETVTTKDTSAESKDLEKNDELDSSTIENSSDENEKMDEEANKKDVSWKSKLENNRKILWIAGGILAIVLLVFLTRDRLVLNPYKVNIGEDVYITLDRLVNEDKTSVELDTLAIKHPFNNEDEYEISYDGLVKTEGLDYLDAGTYEVEVYSTEKDNLSKTVTIEVVDEEAPKFVDFKNKIEIGQDQKFEWTDYFKAKDKSKVEITVDPGQFNVKKLGTYDIIVYATDTAGNQTEKEAKVVVKERKITSIEAKYNGPTKEGSEINQDSDITVTAHFEDETSEEVTGWKLENPATLAANGSSTVKIKYKNSECDLTVKCSTESEAGYKASCGEISYEELARNGNAHIGERVKFYGRVLQVQDNVMRVATKSSGYGYYDDVIYVVNVGPRRGGFNIFDNKEKFLEDDMITFYGEAAGDETYTSIMGASITIPSVYARYIDR